MRLGRRLSAPAFGFAAHSQGPRLSPLLASWDSQSLRPDAGREATEDPRELRRGRILWGAALGCLFVGTVLYASVCDHDALLGVGVGLIASGAILLAVAVMRGVLRRMASRKGRFKYVFASLITLLVAGASTVIVFGFAAFGNFQHCPLFVPF